ncbi:MAG: hypothetical protein HYS05_03770 [Acidobacteria bacterium]|nr:hypothetical protein [Acidobacteriota bacterium]
MMGAQDADELTQDVFVRAWHKLGTFRGESAFGTSLKVAPRRPGLLGRLDTSTGWRVTDQTVPVKKGARLDVNEVGGDIIVRTWDRDAVRIKAQHSRTDSVKIDSLDTVVRVRTASTRGRSHAVDFEITAPAWMPLTLGGQYADVTVEGAQGDVTVETVHGDINVRGGSGFVSLKTVHGVAVLEGAKGRSEVRSVNEAVRVIATSGDTYAESNNGRITFEKMDAKNVEASAVNGDIVYEGAIHRDGVYRLSTHNGNIVMGVTNGTNATINVEK